MITNLENNNIDIARIQETHNERNDYLKKEKYAILFSGLDGKEHKSKTNIKAGVAIAIKNTLLNNITQVNRVNNRIMEIRIKTGKNLQNINILNTYAPDMNHNDNDIYQYWQQVERLIEKIPKKITQIWCTDNNGQIARNGNNKNHIGKWTTSTKTEAGNGKQLEEICKENNLICSSTFFIPKNKERGELATWHNYDGTIARQIDYFMISQNQRNWVISIDNKQMANTRTPMQHKMLKIHIRIKLKSHKTNKDLIKQPYDLKEYRKQPTITNNKLKNIILNEIKNDNYNWESMTNNIKNILNETYQHKTINTKKEILT